MKYSAMILTLLLASQTACFSTGDKDAKDPLDIAIKKVPVHKEGVSTAKGSDDGTIIMAPNTVIDWQRFFSPSPTPAQKARLLQSLKTQKETASAKELLKRGRRQIAVGKTKAAEASLRLALRKTENQGDILLALCQLYLRTGEYSKTLDLLSQLKESVDDLPNGNASLIFRYRYLLALTYIELGDTAKGNSILTELLAIEPSFSPGYVALASSYLRHSKLKVAEFIAKRGLDRNKPTASLYNILGIVYQKKNNHVKARTYFNKAIKVDPNHSQTIINRANSMIAQSEFEAAELSLQRAISLNPGNHAAYVSLGICQKRMGRNNSARISFEKALDLFPDSASARFNLGVLMMEEYDKPTAALRLFHEVLQVREHVPEVKKMANLYIEDLTNNRRR